MTHKEFYHWLEGFMSERHWTMYREREIKMILEKMKDVKDEPKSGITEQYRAIPMPTIPMPINPFPIKDDPYKPPYEVYCGDKTQLND